MEDSFYKTRKNETKAPPIKSNLKMNKDSSFFNDFYDFNCSKKPPILPNVKAINDSKMIQRRHTFSDKKQKKYVPTCHSNINNDSRFLMEDNSIQKINQIEIELLSGNNSLKNKNYQSRQMVPLSDVKRNKELSFWNLLYENEPVTAKPPIIVKTSEPKNILKPIRRQSVLEKKVSIQEPFIKTTDSRTNLYNGETKKVNLLEKELTMLRLKN